MEKNLIVFDMDGVLVDVSRSYRDVVRQTALTFFEGARGWEVLPKPLATLADIAAVKQSGGLNNDWDLTCRVLSLLMSQVGATGGPSVTGAESRSDYRAMVKRWDVSSLGTYLKETEQPLAQLLKREGEDLHPIIQGLYQGDVGSGNIIKEIFQEIYLGKDLFEETYSVPAKRYRGEGFIQREDLLINRTILERLFQIGLLAIATGRPRIEAEYSLNRFQLSGFFSAIYTLDDCLDEEAGRRERGEEERFLSKPNPFMLDAIAAQPAFKSDKYYYVGDMPDDMLAASRAKEPFQGIGILLSAPEKERLREGMQQAGAKHIVDSFKELMYLLERDKPA